MTAIAQQRYDDGERSAAIERRWGAELGPEVLEEVRTALQHLDEIDVPGANARRSSLGQTVRRGHRSTLIER